MNNTNLENFEFYMKSRPHVVILGAGASCAAIPNGDKYGRKISAMSGFIDIHIYLQGCCRQAAARSHGLLPA